MLMIKVINPKNGLSKEINGEAYTYGDFKKLCEFYYNVGYYIKVYR